MSALKRLITRLRRTGSGRGFGIQSPTDYNFVCHVVNEQWPYYAYDDLRNELPGMPAHDRHKAELAFRVANYIQPEATVNIGLPKWWTIYAARGCRQSIIYYGHGTGLLAQKAQSGQTQEAEYGKTLTMMRCGETVGSGLEAIMARMKHGCCLIADGINSSNAAQEQWQAIAGDRRSTLVFDLYDLGIVIADAKRSKAQYKINY